MKYRVKPEEHELRKARNTVQGALEASKATMEKEGELSIELGWTGDEFILENMMGVTGFTPSENRIEIQFNSTVDGWKDSLKNTVAQEFAHAVFLENMVYQELNFNWQRVLLEAHAQNFAAKVFPDTETPWRAVNKGRIRDLWPELKEAIDSEIHEESNQVYAEEELPEWIEYSAAYLVGQKILEQHELEELPELKRSDVIEAGDELFGGNA